MGKITFIFIFFALFSSCSSDTSSTDITTNKLIDVTSQASLESEIKEGVSLVFFHATWCSKCKAQRPAIEKIIVDTKLSTVFFGEVDYEKVKTVVDKYQVAGFPTIVFFKNGVETERLLGQGHSSEEIKDILLALL